MCSQTGGIGTAWYFDRDQSTLYLRLVNLACYNAALKEECATNGYFEHAGMRLWNTDRNIGLLLEVVRCNGCEESGTYGGMTYFEIEDIPPSNLWVGPQEVVEDPGVPGGGLPPFPVDDEEIPQSTEITCTSKWHKLASYS